MAGVLIAAIALGIYFAALYVLSVRDRLRLEQRIDELDELLQDRAE